MTTQRNIYRDAHTGAWIVAFRKHGDLFWTRVYVGGSEAAARAAYKRLVAAR